MAYIRATSNPESLYVYESAAHINFSWKDYKDEHQQASGPIDLWQQFCKDLKPNDYFAIRFAWFNKKIGIVLDKWDGDSNTNATRELTVGDKKIYMWDVTWESLLSSIRMRYPKEDKKKHKWEFFD